MLFLISPGLRLYEFRITNGPTSALRHVTRELWRTHQLNTRPAVSPVNASRRPSRDAAHHSGSGRMASPYPMGDFPLLFFASFPGALRDGVNRVGLAMSEPLPLYP